MTLLLTPSRVDGEVVKTCESVTVNIEGVYWEWPNNFVAWVCYPGELTTERTFATLAGKTVVLRGSRQALDALTQ